MVRESRRLFRHARRPAGGRARASITIGGLKALGRRIVPAPLYRLYRKRRIALLIAGYENRQVTHTYGGSTLTIELADGPSASYYDRDWGSPVEIEYARERGLQPGSRVFDLGAHQGVVALMLADLVGPTGRVVALEADFHNARMAERNRVLNGAANLEIVHAAAAQTTGTVLFTGGLNGHIEDRGGAWGKSEVAALSLDDLAARYGSPDVVLIDVEGYEDRVLAGAATTIAARRTTFLIEVHVGCGLEVPPAQIARVFESLYSVDVAPAGGGTGSFEPYQPGLPMPHDRFFLIATPR